MLHKVAQSFCHRLRLLTETHPSYPAIFGPLKFVYMQIENEYKNVEAAFHEKGPPYVRWAAKMAVDLQTGVPWVMCKQDDAPDPVVSPLLLVISHGLDSRHMSISFKTF